MNSGHTLHVVFFSDEFILTSQFQFHHRYPLCQRLGLCIICGFILLCNKKNQPRQHPQGIDDADADARHTCSYTCMCVSSVCVCACACGCRITNQMSYIPIPISIELPVGSIYTPPLLYC